MKFYSLLLAGVITAFLPSVCNAEYVPLETKSAVQQDFQNSMEYFNQAYEAYFRAKNTSEPIEKADFYVQAISNISKANTCENENVAYIALQMQIYRGKGVLPYAKSAFLRAEKLLQNNLEQTPNDVGALLDYAILCRAGDMAYRIESREYYAKSQQLAEKVCNVLARDNNADALIAKAMANLVLENESEFKALLAEAILLEGKDFGRSSFYLNLYDETVAQNIWLWPVAEKYLQNEYLLYYLCDLSRTYKF